MNTIKWQDLWNTGIESIDAQHKVLVRLINDLNSATDKEVCKKVFLELSEYINSHFRHEEDLFDKTNYPKAEEHIRQHIALFDKTVYLKDRLFNDPFFDKDELSKFLIEWLAVHIIKQDKEFGNFLVKKVLSEKD